MAEKSMIEKLLDKFKKPKVVHEAIDPSSVKENHLVRDLAIENAELKGKLMKIEAEKGEKRESDKDKEEEDEVRLVLDKRSKELREKADVKFFSLRMLFQNLFYNKNFKNRLKYVTFDRKTILSQFSDWGFSSDGDIVLLDDKGEVLLKGKTLTDIFQSVPALETDIMNGIIPINLDEEKGYVENLQVSELAEIVPTEDGKFYYSKAKKKPLYQYVQELQNDISDLKSEIEVLETTNGNVQMQNDDLSRTTRVLQNMVNVFRKNYGENEKAFNGINQIFTDQSRELMQQRLYNSNLEEWSEALETVAEELRARAEREKTKLSDDKAFEKINRMKTEMQNFILPIALNPPIMPQNVQEMERKDKNGE